MDGDERKRLVRDVIQRAAREADWTRPHLYYLSFCDGDLPKGSQFLGAAIVEAPCIELASPLAHAVGCNPGGEVLMAELPDELRTMISPEARWRVLSRADLEAMGWDPQRVDLDDDEEDGIEELE